MSKLIENEADLADIIQDQEGVFVMVYASWCPFSARFLPIFEKHSTDKTSKCARVMVDDLEKVSAAYAVDVYPTVLYFRNGKLAKRLDGIHGIGLDEKQLKDFFNACKR